MTPWSSHEYNTACRWFPSDELKQMPIISNAYLTFGAYDVIAEIETDDQEGFEKVVATIRKLSRVVSTMTLNVIDTSK